MSRMTNASRVLGLLLFPALLVAPAALLAQSTQVITGPAAFTDYSKEHPGTMRKITVADLPAPYATESVDNGPSLVPRPAGAMPEAPAGFKVELYSSDVKNPRLDPHRTQRRPVRGGERAGPQRRQRNRKGLSRRGCERQGEAGFHLRHRTEAAFRPGVLSARTESKVDLHRQHRLGRQVPLQERGYEGERAVAGGGGGAARRRAPARRRPLDARRRLLEGRAAHVRLRRLALERG